MTKKWYIRSPDQGYFIGSFLGLGFFEASIEDGDCSEAERPCEFDSRADAETYLASWIGGPCGCVVTDVPSERTV